MCCIRQGYQPIGDGKKKYKPPKGGSAFTKTIKKETRIMPYITKEDRRRILRENIGINTLKIMAGNIQTVGDFNYVISQLYVHLVNKDPEGPKYHVRSKWRGAINDSANEMYDRFMRGYEDRAKEKNGDLDGAKELI